MADIDRFYDNQNLVYHIIHKYFKGQEDFDDLVQVGLMALYETSINPNFDPSKSKFVSYAYTNIFRKMLSFIKKNRKNKVEFSINTDIIDYRSNNKEVSIMDVLPWISDHELEILELRLKGMKYKDIAKKYNCSKQRIGFIVKSIYREWEKQRS